MLPLAYMTCLSSSVTLHHTEYLMIQVLYNNNNNNNNDDDNNNNFIETKLQDTIGK